MCKSNVIKILYLKSKALSTGDLNARHLQWNCVTNNANGKELINACLDLGVEIAAP